MKLEDFLITFVQQLNNTKISHCILRNYVGLPQENLSNDIDFLIEPENIETVINILSGIKKVNVTGIIRRPSVVSIFINGVNWGLNRLAIELDFVLLIAWKGLPYLSTSQVLVQAQNIAESGGLLKKPAPYHEAIITFFSSYLVGGWIKEKYQPIIQKSFLLEKNQIIPELCVFLPEKVATTLVAAIIKDERNSILSLLPSIKWQLITSSLTRSFFHSLKAILVHHLVEIKIRYTPFPTNTICFLGADGAGKSTVISGVVNRLKDTTKDVACYHLKPSLFKSKSAPFIVTDPHAKPPRSSFLSVGKVIFWLLLYWLDRFFHGHKSLTLKIWDRYYYDLLIDPRRYRYGAPMWFARLVSKVIPSPDLVILLDAPEKTLQNRKKEVSVEETARQRDAYLHYVESLENGVVIDASQSLEQVIQDTTEKILYFLIQNVKKHHSR